MKNKIRIMMVVAASAALFSGCTDETASQTQQNTAWLKGFMAGMKFQQRITAGEFQSKAEAEEAQRQMEAEFMATMR